jgi:hypothetical protein
MKCRKPVEPSHTSLQHQPDVKCSITPSKVRPEPKKRAAPPQKKVVVDPLLKILQDTNARDTIDIEEHVLGVHVKLPSTCLKWVSFVVFFLTCVM